MSGYLPDTNLTIATRNVRDFGDLNVDVINPWNGP